MKDLVVLGAQWGDEGKGKVVDLLSKDFDVAVRYQGGSNAGHTVVINGKKYALHLLPTGVLHEHVKIVIAQGMVVDLEVLLKEISQIEAGGTKVIDRLYISDRVHVVFEYHKLMDSLLERRNKIGTTLRGIGPAYMFKYGRKGIRIGDIKDKDRFYKLLKENVEFVGEICERVYCEKHTLDVDKIYEETLKAYEYIKDRVVDVSYFLLNTNGTVLFEGAQGTLLDVDMGTYPYVTSSNASALGLTNGTGLPPKYFKDCYFLGVSKAYTTRVGEGPFPTELEGEEGDRLREAGNEFGTTTGRPRRCGWLDLVALKYAVRINGLDGLVLTKLDVLDTFEEVKVCVAYELDGQTIYDFPSDLYTLSKVKPVYKTLKGWMRSTRGIVKIQDLPEEAKGYVRFIEEYVNCPVVMLSTGPEREAYLWLRRP
ncbi:adenylosuccinate synthase [Thermocrinis minervae]|uniref:Adenylosuccinate synthetase n=1 Tax=Thermocrinis minervae TaxID=381751 RepID=A0A1M6T8R0_9AQUI|nr:adenylosuccinate synthase [Thermocrinis minervae]SHK53381.1 Adenylosuccinate synthetase [Thermocrinis minervae]